MFSGCAWTVYGYHLIKRLFYVEFRRLIRASWWLDKTIEINRNILLILRPLKWWILFFDCYEKSDMEAISLIEFRLDIGNGYQVKTFSNGSMLTTTGWNITIAFFYVVISITYSVFYVFACNRVIKYWHFQKSSHFENSRVNHFFNTPLKHLRFIWNFFTKKCVAVWAEDYWLPNEPPGNCETGQVLQ